MFLLNSSVLPHSLLPPPPFLLSQLLHSVTYPNLLQLLFLLCVPYILAKVATAEECLANAVGMNRYAMDFSHRGSVTHSSSLYKRLTCGDSHLAGGPATTTSGSRTNPVPSGGSSSPGLRLPASSPKRNGTAIEGNRCGNAMHTLETLHRGEVRVILNMTPLGN